MTKPLDPLFIKVVALMRSTEHEGERASAQKRAAAIAARCGMTFEEAIRIHDAPATAKAGKAKPASKSPFEDIDDWMEKKEPGWKAKRSAERAEKVRAWTIRKAAILARYGSVEAAAAPCWREKLILLAVTPWRTVQRRPYERWTDKLDGWRDALQGYRKAPPHVIAAISTAYPMPTTFAEAKAESDYWEARDNDLRDLFSKDGSGTDLGDTTLDFAASLRADMVRDLAERDLPVTTLADLHARFALYRDREYHDIETEDAIFRDLTTLVERQEAAPVPSPTAAPPAPRSRRPELVGQLKEALKADARRSDRWIARALGCSPTTVGGVRRDMGLAGERRSVQRQGGQIYEMKPAERTAHHPREQEPGE